MHTLRTEIVLRIYDTESPRGEISNMARERRTYPVRHGPLLSGQRLCSESSSSA